MSNDIERRAFIAEIRKENKESGKLEGHAAIFNDPAEIQTFSGAFREVIKPGAFREAIKRKDDVRALFNHDSNFVLGRTKSGTLTLKEDERGLKISIDPPETSFAKDLTESISRGDIDQMSFGFRVTEETWREGEDGDLDTREINSVELFDVSPVTFPAYQNTDIAVRSWDNYRKEKGGLINTYRAKAKLIKHRANIRRIS